jgi:pimeloyl-ACP methyl ester carboxylesterase
MKTITHQLSGLLLTDHIFNIPLDHAAPDGERLEVYAREVVAPNRAAEQLPWLVFFQGGPGLPAPRPPALASWLPRALRQYRVLLLDQRGTGRSTPVTFQTLARFASPQAQADYLKHFRADNIVRDAEWIRRELLGASGRWTVLGQSYGGFCIAHYLSAAPDALEAAIFTGGLPPLERSVDEIYRASYRRVIAKNQRYYERYPDDAAQARRIVDALSERPAPLPAGGQLSPRRFQALGLDFGDSAGFEKVHYLLEEAFVIGACGPELSYGFLHGVEAAHRFETNPIYAILQEACYTQAAASRWSAERVRVEYREFDLSPERPVFFTGEMIYPWMYDEYPKLRPLKGAAELLAEFDGWPRLYDPAVLRNNRVPCAAAVYYDDMYVERAFSQETAQTIRGLKMWVTNEYEHNGLRADGEKVLGRLLAMVEGS